MKTLWILGTGMGRENLMTGETLERLSAVPAVMGAGRMLENLKPRLEGKKTLTSYQPEEMLSWVKQEEIYEAAALMSGDTGFYSGAKKVSEVFEKEGWKVTFLPGISSLSYFCARLKKSWQDMRLVSVHGRDADIVWEVENHPVCFFLSGGEKGISSICGTLVRAGLGDCRVWTGENLSYPEERITEGRAEDFKEVSCSSLSCMIVENPAWKSSAGLCPGLKDEEFIRGKVPMTKCEVRTISISKLELKPGDVFYDIGAGTGSVTIEAGRLLRASGGRVYAVEQKEEAAALIEENAKKHLPEWKNLSVVRGSAPEALTDLEKPDCAFLGGTAGRMKEIIRCLLEKNPEIRIVINVITLESLAEALSCIREFSWKDSEIINLSLSRMEQAGSYHMPKPQSPIYIISLKGAGYEKNHDNSR